MDPPWRKYPEIPAGSIGWRMGPGEDYRWDFYDWFSFLPDDEKTAYMAANPAPEGWRNLYKTIIDKPSTRPPMSAAEREAAAQENLKMVEEFNRRPVTRVEREQIERVRKLLDEAVRAAAGSKPSRSD